MTSIKEVQNKNVLEYIIPIKESANVDGEFKIKGIAISETTTSNNHKFVAEELRKSADTLTGVPLLVDHNNTVESIKGRVISSNFDELNKNILFEAKVMDKNIKEMIKDGRINSVSIGATVESLEEEEGAYIVRGINFKELSLVAVPADSHATFAVALKECYERMHEDDIEYEEEDVPEFEEDVDNLPDNDIELKGGQTMVETTNSNENTEIEQLKIKLAEQETILSAYKMKERQELESSYNTLCEKKKCKPLNLSSMTDESIKLLMSQIESMEVIENEVKPEIKEEVETEESDNSNPFNVIESYGSVKGGSFTIVKNKY